MTGVNWIHTTSILISTAALSSWSLRRYLSHIYNHGWTKAIATVVISVTATVMTSGLCTVDPIPLYPPSSLLYLCGWSDAKNPNRVARSMCPFKAISSTVYERGTTVPGWLTSAKDAMVSDYHHIHWTRYIYGTFYICTSSNEGIMTSYTNII